MASSMAKEGRLRKLHRRDWPGFLNRVIPARVWQDFYSLVESSTDGRVRWTAKYVLLCWIIMGWSECGSLAGRLTEGRSVLAGLFPSRRRPGHSYQGLIRATRQLGSAFFYQWWCCLRGTICRHVGRPTWYWYGWNVMAVDGSRINAPRTVPNENELGIAGRAKTHPQSWITFIVHLPTNILWDWRQGPSRDSERAHLRTMLGDLPDKTLLVGDIGFTGYDLMRQMLGHRVDFLIRFGGGTSTLLTEESRYRIERRGESRHIFLWPLNRRRKPPLCLRLIVLKDKGKRVYLVTNVMDTTRLSRRTAGELYQARWGIEVGYRSLKQTLGHRKVLGRTPDVASMEIAANILALALLMLHGAVTLRAKVTLLSVAKALHAIRKAMAALIYKVANNKFLAMLRTALRDTYERKKSKRARDWPNKKNERPPGPPKFRRLTRKEKAKIIAFAEENLVVT